MNQTLATSHTERTKSLWAATGAYLAWGLMPLYWRLLDAAPAVEILLHRIFWSFVLLSIIILYTKQLRTCLQSLFKPKLFIQILVCSVLLSANWLIYIWAINAGYVLDTSLGYFLNPLLNIMLGVFIFKERPSKWQWISIAIAIGGVLLQIIILGTVPIISLSLAITFALYGVIRKTSPFASLPGLFLETIIMIPFVMLGLSYYAYTNQAHFGSSLNISLIFMGSCLITTLPLLWFAYSARRLRLTTIGIFQYISPSTSMLLAIFVFKETLVPAKMLSFACIWLSLIIYTLESLRIHRSTANINLKNKVNT